METITLTRQEIKEIFKLWWEDTKENSEEFYTVKEEMEFNDAESYSSDAANYFLKQADLVKRGINKNDRY